MNQKTFNTWAGVVFAIAFVIHGLRLIKGWDVSIGTYDAPMWASWVAIVVTGCLAYHGLFKKR